MAVWNHGKNELLKKERDVSFEEILVQIVAGDLARVYRHSNQVRYPDQRVVAVLTNDYVYLVPFVEAETDIFFETIVPSRKATRNLTGAK